MDTPSPQADSRSRGDLASLLSLEEVSDGSLREVNDLRGLRSYLERSMFPLTDLSNVLEAQKDLLVDIPTLWPLRGVRGVITHRFGTAEHPFTGQWYLHRGLDIAHRTGTPIVATANGKITRVDYDARGFGNFVDIRHKYGFSTRYAHMSRTYVTKGQDVLRGQVIGAMGSTGLSTGPHVHYEVWIGTQLVDPEKYLNISSDIVR